MPISVAPRHIAAAAMLSFAESGGGPILACPSVAVSHWRGCFDDDGAIDESGESDYDRACNAGWAELLPVGSHHALVLPTPDISAAWSPDGDTWYIVRWVGADTAAALLATAEAVPPNEWTDTGARFEIPNGGLLMFDSAASGKLPDSLADEPTSAVQIPAGTWAIDSCEEQSGIAVHPDGTKEELMAEVIRLRRIGELA